MYKNFALNLFYELFVNVFSFLAVQLLMQEWIELLQKTHNCGTFETDNYVLYKYIEFFFLLKSFYYPCSFPCIQLMMTEYMESVDKTSDRYTFVTTLLFYFSNLFVCYTLNSQISLSSCMSIKTGLFSLWISVVSLLQFLVL